MPADLNDIRLRLKKIIVNQLGVDEQQVVPNASFVEDLGADERDVTELFLSIEEEFQLNIPDEEEFDPTKITTVQEAEDYIYKHLR